VSPSSAAIAALIVGIVVIALPVCIRAYRRRGAALARIRRWQTLWDRTERDRRAPVFYQLLKDHDASPEADHPGRERVRAEIAFLCGCAHLEEQDACAAARMFQVAYHADPKLNTALVLAFACLKVGTQSDRPSDGQPSPHTAALLEKCAETWDELGRPPVGRRARERALITAGESVEQLMRSLTQAEIR